MARYCVFSIKKALNIDSSFYPERQANSVKRSFDTQKSQQDLFDTMVRFRFGPSTNFIGERRSVTNIHLRVDGVGIARLTVTYIIDFATCFLKQAA